jgi:hypothetical protein
MAMSVVLLSFARGMQLLPDVLARPATMQAELLERTADVVFVIGQHSNSMWQESAEKWR